MILETIELEPVPGRPDIAIEGDSDAQSEDFVIRVTDGWLNCTIHLNAKRLAEFRDCIDEALAKSELCEHGITDGEWCPECNREYKQAEIDNA